MNEKIQVLQADITKMNVDAIVNAANTTLLGGGGVDGAIHRAAGPKLHEECLSIVSRKGGCATGDAVITGAGNLPAKQVIHAVGPVYRDGKKNEASLLESAYIKSLKLAEKNGLKSIAFPNIGVGAYGFPKEEAAKIALRAVSSFLKDSSVVEKVFFVCYENDNFEIYKRLASETFDAGAHGTKGK